MRDGRHRMLLEVVRRQPVVLWAHVRPRRMPRCGAPACAGSSAWSGDEPRLATRQRPADPPRDAPARRTTAAGSGAATASAGGARARAAAPPASGEHRARSTSPAARPRARAPRGRRARALGVVGPRLPLEQAAPRDEHPPGGAHDRVEVHRRLVGQERERQHRLREAARRPRAAVASQVLAQRHLVGLAQQVDSVARWPRAAAGRRAPRASTARGSPAAPSSRASSSTVSAGGTRLRRRLSKSFHSDSADSGLRSRRAAGPGHARQQPAGQLPVAANPAMAPARCPRA